MSHRLNRAPTWLAPIALMGVVAVSACSGATPAPSSATAIATTSGPSTPATSSAPTTSSATPSPSVSSTSPTASKPAPSPSTSAVRAAPAAGGPRAQTSCTSVTHVGDSTSVGLDSPAVLPNKADRISAQYTDVGAKNVYLDISGARSIVERFKGEPNAEDAMISRVAKGFTGCWVMAMGNNEAANVSVGGSPGLAARIDIVMKQANGMPVLWPTTKTLRTSGPWLEANMVGWNAKLEQACARYPNLRVYDWSAEVADSWFGPDQIHFSVKGWRERGRHFADALAVAFPAGAPPAASCVVRTTG